MPLKLITYQLGMPRQPGEGLRLGVVRRPPRGVRKADYARLDYYDVWLPVLAPSAPLLSWIHGQDLEAEAVWRRFTARPQPYNFHDGVLLMELVTDAHGDAAPRLNDLSFTPEAARTHHATLIAEVVRMLCAGVVHGDLSEFNILLAHTPGDGLAPDGGGGGHDVPVIIDLPQAVDAAGNNHAQRMLLRDVANLRDFFGQFAPDLLATFWLGRCTG